MSEITKHLHNTEAAKSPVGVVQREQSFAPISERTVHMKGEANTVTENQGGSRWSIGNDRAAYICKCGFSGTFPLSVYGPKPKSLCCVDALPFPVVE